MIFGAKEEIIPKYYDDDKPKSVQKTVFGLVLIILLWLGKLHNLAPYFYHYSTKKRNNKYFLAKYLDFDKIFMYNR